MKRTLIGLAALFLAGSLAASDQTSTAAAPTQAVADSPLVAAAKKANRSGKKGRVVITNESLKDSKGHITTTKMDISLNVPVPEQPLELVMRESKEREKLRAAEREKAAKAASAARQQQIARAVAEVEEEGPYGADPAATEGHLQQQTSTAAPTSSQPQPSKHDG